MFDNIGTRTVEVPKLFEKLFARVLACDAGDPGSIPGQDMFVSGCASREWTLVQSFHS